MFRFVSINTPAMALLIGLYFPFLSWAVMFVFYRGTTVQRDLNLGEITHE